MRTRLGGITHVALAGGVLAVGCSLGDLRFDLTDGGGGATTTSSTSGTVTASSSSKQASSAASTGGGTGGCSVSLGGNCLDQAQCCGGALCTLGQCTAACTTDGNACMASADCCSGCCGAGACAGPGCGTSASASSSSGGPPTSCAQTNGVIGCCSATGIRYYCTASMVLEQQVCAGSTVCGWNAAQLRYACVPPPGGPDPTNQYPEPCE